jgi:hypothetical protein
MKIKVTHSFVYDSEDPEFFEEFRQYMDDHILSFSGFQEFIIDRFINPNFDKGGTTTLEILPLTKCARCDSMLSFDNVSEGYYAVCPEHDEDLYEVECI